ncbi:MAG: hypothetical protein L3J10_02195 [Sulfurimonas sp.]|nr:hypothetical protein [Sulfurimonas sp.]
MKLKMLLSILFLIVTTFSAIHEIEHIAHNDSSSCLICHVNDNLALDDIQDKFKNIEIFYFEKNSYSNQVLSLHIKKYTDQNQAPPSLS